MKLRFDSIISDQCKTLIASSLMSYLTVNSLVVQFQRFTKRRRKAQSLLKNFALKFKTYKLKLKQVFMDSCQQYLLNFYEKERVLEEVLYPIFFHMKQQNPGIFSITTWLMLPEKQNILLFLRIQKDNFNLQFYSLYAEH